MFTNHGSKDPQTQQNACSPVPTVNIQNIFCHAACLCEIHKALSVPSLHWLHDVPKPSCYGFL